MNFKKLLIVGLFLFSFFNNFSQESAPTLSAGLDNVAFNKGSLDVELITKIIKEKQKELAREGIKRVLFNKISNNNEIDFYSQFYIERVVNILFSETNHQVMTKKILEETTNYLLVLGVTDYLLKNHTKELTEIFFFLKDKTSLTKIDNKTEKEQIIYLIYQITKEIPAIKSLDFLNSFNSLELSPLYQHYRLQNANEVVNLFKSVIQGKNINPFSLTQIINFKEKINLDKHLKQILNTINKDNVDSVIKSQIDTIKVKYNKFKKLYSTLNNSKTLKKKNNLFKNQKKYLKENHYTDKEVEIIVNEEKTQFINSNYKGYRLLIFYNKMDNILLNYDKIKLIIESLFTETDKLKSIFELVKLNNGSLKEILIDFEKKFNNDYKLSEMVFKNKNNEHLTFYDITDSIYKEYKYQLSEIKNLNIENTNAYIENLKTKDSINKDSIRKYRSILISLDTGLKSFDNLIEISEKYDSFLKFKYQDKNYIKGSNHLDFFKKYFKNNKKLIPNNDKNFFNSKPDNKLIYDSHITNLKTNLNNFKSNNIFFSNSKRLQNSIKQTKDTLSLLYKALRFKNDISNGEYDKSFIKSVKLLKNKKINEVLNYFSDDKFSDLVIVYKLKYKGKFDDFDDFDEYFNIPDTLKEYFKGMNFKNLIEINSSITLKSSIKKDNFFKLYDITNIKNEIDTIIKNIITNNIKSLNILKNNLENISLINLEDNLKKVSVTLSQVKENLTLSAIGANNDIDLFNQIKENIITLDLENYSNNEYLKLESLEKFYKIILDRNLNEKIKNLEIFNLLDSNLISDLYYINSLKSNDKLKRIIKSTEFVVNNILSKQVKNTIKEFNINDNSSNEIINFIKFIANIKEMNKSETFSFLLRNMNEYEKLLSVGGENKKIISDIINSLRTYTIINNDNNSIEIDAGSLLANLSEKHSTKNKWGFYATVGLNNFWVPNGFGEDENGNPYKQFNAASEKIGIRYKWTDWENNAKINENKLINNISKKPYVSNFYSMIYASGILYKITDTSSNSYDTVNFGVATGFTFFNSLDFNVSISFPAEGKVLKNHVIGFSFDIPLSEYLKRL